jgi:hypothetical protein
MMRNLTRAMLGAAMAAPLALGISSAAHAEKAPNCSSTVQIGQTATLNVNGQTFASVKQFKGCGKNFAYLYVWQSYRASHHSWDACAGVATVDGSGRHLDPNDLNCLGNTVEVWSHGRATLSQCTVGVGSENGEPGWPDDPTVSTDVRC